jgi:hypothetical protein
VEVGLPYLQRQRRQQLPGFLQIGRVKPFRKPASDTDPVVTSGYGDTGFGALGNEPPVPTPEEPSLSESDEDTGR